MPQKVEVFYLWLLTILENSQPRWNAVSMLRVKIVSSDRHWENKSRMFKIFKILILSVSCKFLSESPSRLEKIWNRTSNGRSLKWTDWQRFRDRFTLLDALQQFLAFSDWKLFLNSLWALKIKNPKFFCQGSTSGDTARPPIFSPDWDGSFDVQPDRAEKKESPSPARSTTIRSCIFNLQYEKVGQIYSLNNSASLF